MRLACFFLLYLSLNAWAQLPDCYDRSSVSPEFAAPAPQREVFIFIDQTTPLTAELQNDVRKITSQLIQPGTAFVLGVFSAFSENRHLSILAEGTLQTTLSKASRASVGVKKLKNLDRCLEKQKQLGRKLAANALQKALQETQTNLAHSDILNSLSAIAQRLAIAKTDNKLLLIASDMLENSSISSFYHRKNMRTLDVQAELKKVEQNALFANFQRARVYVLGAAIIENNPSGYRDPKSLKKLEDFWRAYFQNSNAQLKAFGTPALLVPVE